MPLTANKRSVWSFPTQPNKLPHFAAFPEKLVEPCILAGTSGHGVCAECGAPYHRILKETTTVSWQPTCDHLPDVVPATVLDPFAGSGTTGIVAIRLGRSFIRIELNPAYVKMSNKRTDGIKMQMDMGV